MSLDKGTLELLEEYWPSLAWVADFKGKSGVDINNLFDVLWQSSAYSTSREALEKEIENQIEARTPWTPEIATVMQMWTAGIAKNMEAEVYAKVQVIAQDMLMHPGKYSIDRVEREVFEAWRVAYTKALAWANGRLSTITEIQESYYRPFMRRYFIMNAVYRALSFVEKTLGRECLEVAWRHFVAFMGHVTGKGLVHKVVGGLLRGTEWSLQTAVHPLDRAFELLKAAYKIVHGNWRMALRWIRETGHEVATLGPVAVGVAAKYALPYVGLAGLAAASAAFGYYLARGAYEALKALGVVGLPEATDENFAQVTELPLEERSAVRAEAERVASELGEIAKEYKSLVTEVGDARLGKGALSFSFGLRLDQLEARVRALTSSYAPDVVEAIRAQLERMISEMRSGAEKGGYVSGALTFGAAEGVDLVAELEGIVGVPDMVEYLTPFIVAELQARGLMDPSEEEVEAVVKAVAEAQRAGLTDFLERRMRERFTELAAPAEDAGVATAAQAMEDVARLLQAQSADKDAYVMATRRLMDVAGGLPDEARTMVDEVVADLSELLAAWGEPRGGGGARTPEESAAAR